MSTTSPFKKRWILGLAAGAALLAALVLRPETPDPMGSVGLLTQPTTLYSVYLDLEIRQWDPQDREFQEGQLALALHWLQEQGTQYGATLDLATQLQDPALARQALYQGPVGDGTGPVVTEFDQWARDLCRQLGQESPGQRVGVLFFLPGQGQSYSMIYKPEYDKEYYYEYSIIYQYQPQRQPVQWWGAAATAHEILHLFGAVDLYPGQESLPEDLAEQILQAYPREIMYTTYDPQGYGDLEKISQQLSPFTAYRVGLTEDLGDLAELTPLTQVPPGQWASPAQYQIMEGKENP